MILCLETATPSCSVALIHDGNVLQCEEEPKGQNHSEKLTLFIDSVMKKAGVRFNQLDAVAVSGGPGSYTGLRIGVSMAKGICYGRDLKLLSVPTTELLCVPVLLGEEELPEDALLCPMIDARRMEVYATLYDRSLHVVRPTSADVVEAETYREWLDKAPVYFFGNGAAKCMDSIAHKNARLIEGIEPLAQWMCAPAEKRLLDGQTEDVAYYEPFYLKNFVAQMPKKLL